MVADSAADSPSSSFHMSLDAGEQNHRKRRRNRMRVSCLNCYASKRKVRAHDVSRTLSLPDTPKTQCDRKRPCTRCIKHGLVRIFSLALSRRRPIFVICSRPVSASTSSTIPPPGTPPSPCLLFSQFPCHTDALYTYTGTRRSSTRRRGSRTASPSSSPSSAR